MTYFVYTATNRTNGKTYHGKTQDLAARRYRHEYDAAHGSNLPFHRAIRKHGQASFVWSVAGEFDAESDADALEIELIADTIHGRGYNVTAGGDGGHTMTREQVEAQYTIGPARYDEFRRLVSSSKSVREVASGMGVATNAVVRTAKRLGVELPKGRRGRKPGDPLREGEFAIKPDRYQEFIRVAGEAKSIYAMCAILGVSNTAVRTCAKKLGIPLPVGQRGKATKYDKPLRTGTYNPVYYNRMMAKRRGD